MHSHGIQEKKLWYSYQVSMKELQVLVRFPVLESCRVCVYLLEGNLRISHCQKLRKPVGKLHESCMFQQISCVSNLQFFVVYSYIVYTYPPFPSTQLPWLEGSPMLQGLTWQEGSAALPEDFPSHCIPMAGGISSLARGFVPSPLTPLL